MLKLCASIELVKLNFEISILDWNSTSQDTPMYKVSSISDYNKFIFLIQRGVSSEMHVLDILKFIKISSRNSLKSFIIITYN